MRQLNDKQEAFCHLYVADSNATKAAIGAKYSEKTAYSIGGRLLKKVEVQSRINELRSEHFKKLHMSAEEAMAQVARMARFDPRKLVDENGNPKPIHLLDDDTALALTGVDFESERRRIVKMVKDGDGVEDSTVTRIHKYRTDKAKAQEMILRVHGRFEKDNKQKGDAVGEALGNAIARARDTGGTATLLKPRKT